MILEILKHPLTISLTSVALGTGLLGRIDYKRKKRDVIRDKSLEFLDLVGTDLNSALSKIFHHLREYKTECSSDLMESSAKLYTMRLSVRIKSKSYLEDPEFSKAYDQITHHIRYIMNEISEIKSLDKPKEKENEILERIENHAEIWHIPLTLSKENLRSPYHALLTWNNLLWARTNDILSDAINKSLGKRIKKKSRD